MALESHPERLKRGRPWRWWPLLAALLIATAAGWGAGLTAERRAIEAAEATMRTDAQLRAALLASEVARFRLLPLSLGDDRDVAGALDGADDARAALNRKLERLAQETGAAQIYLLSSSGRTVASSNWRSPRSFVGQDYAFRRYFREAAARGSAAQFALGTISGEPGLYLSGRTPEGGVIVVKLEFDRIENQWARAGGTTFVENGDGIVLVTSDPALRFATTRPLASAAIERFRDELQSGAESLRPLPARGKQLMVTVPTAIADWRLVLKRPKRAAVAPSVHTAQIGAAAIVLALLGLAAAVRARARRQARARAAAAQRTAELEEAVAARTVELRQEMSERAASEARAETLREGLRQANRLATLGQVTASVAHETAQPVAAIRTYAANATKLIDRGDTDALKANLESIGRLADRIGTITTQLRGFARKGTGPIGPLALAEAMGGAQLILKERLRGVSLNIALIPPDLRVYAGRVRLEQVLVNLLTNAAEALEGQPDPCIDIAIEPNADIVRLIVADNGPGIAPEVADRLFTPFATTRPKGLGLGLVIAQDILHDLGGSMRLLPGDGGARFEIVLMRAP